MKRTTLIAAVFAASAFAACAADVYSSNVVGYTKVDVSSGFNLLGTQFVNVGDNAALDINQLLNSSDLEGFNASYVFQSWLKVWNGGGYDTYGWSADGQGTANGMPEWDAKWLTSNMSALATEDMLAGNGFWIQTVSPANVTFSGEVSTNDTYEVSVASGFTLVCNPFPQEISIQSVQSDDLEGFNASYVFQSWLKVWNGGGYDTYGWSADGQGTANGMPEWDAKWLTSNMSALANVTIGIGDAFWIQTTGPATITFTK